MFKVEQLKPGELVHNHNLSIANNEVTNTNKYGDYIGFSFGTKSDGSPMHSSDLGIVRTSDGSRFNENLLPTMQDKTVQVPGADGMYYFGSYYTQRQFNISFAFDGLTEFQVAQLKSHFGDKEIHDLIFDECPYKVYSAKVTGTATIKYIAFSEGVTNRLYKGEGSVQFTCYNPFARSRYKFLDEYSDANYPNKHEWKYASGMRKNNKYGDTGRTIDQWDTTDYSGSDTGGRFLLFNPGDKEAEWILTIPFNNNKIPSMMIKLYNKGSKLGLSEITKKQNSTATEIRINSKTNLIEGYKDGKPTGELYNNHIESGAFFKIPVIKKTNDNSDNDNYKAESLLISNVTGVMPTIQYDYIYY